MHRHVPTHGSVATSCGPALLRRRRLPRGYSRRPTVARRLLGVALPRREAYLHAGGRPQWILEGAVDLTGQLFLAAAQVARHSRDEIAVARGGGHVSRLSSARRRGKCPQRQEPHPGQAESTAAHAGRLVIDGSGPSPPQHRPRSLGRDHARHQCPTDQTPLSDPRHELCGELGMAQDRQLGPLPCLKQRAHPAL